MSGWLIVSARAALAGGFALSLLPTTAARAATETVVYTFPGGNDGANPGAGLINLGGIFYGTTAAGGGTGCLGSGCGTVFSLVPPATLGGAWNATTLYRFQGGNDGWQPLGHLIIVGGTLYGTTAYGGAAGHGTVFALAPPAIAGGAWSESVVHAFAGGGDGSDPVGGLNNLSGTLLGATAAGGHGCAHVGCGTVFALAPPAVAGGPWSETQYFRFSYASGAIPRGGLIRINGVLYGATSEGGGDYCTFQGGPGCGTVFALSPPTQAGRPWQQSVLHVFTGPDGNEPSAGLINVGGTLYGTTVEGGAHGFGAVFAVAPPAKAGGAWTETVIHSFNGQDGESPYAHLVSYNGKLYGTTLLGGTGAGTVFALTPPSVRGGAWGFAVLHDFQGGSDGSHPETNLLEVGGIFYGTTTDGGAGHGTVFAVQP